jgi:hypothetical protein
LLVTGAGVLLATGAFVSGALLATGAGVLLATGAFVSGALLATRAGEVTGAGAFVSGALLATGAGDEDAAKEIADIGTDATKNAPAVSNTFCERILLSWFLLFLQEIFLRELNIKIITISCGSILSQVNALGSSNDRGMGCGFA